MLKISNLTIRNFLSVGNSTQAINFNRNELVLILGENLDLGGEDAGSRNGTGKTSILNALSYVLFSWPVSTIKKEHLVNTSNQKNMLVTLDFESNEKSYRIVRGLKPRILEFYENGKKFADKDPLLTESDDSAQGDNRETQREIEKVIGMSHDMFCQIVAINTYTQPFLFQKISDQRNIIEQLLGITLLSEKAEQLKEEIKTAREALTKEDIRIKSVEAANKRIQSQIDSLILRQKAWKKQKSDDLTKLRAKIDKLSKIDIDHELKVHAYWDIFNAHEKDRLNLQQQQNQMNLAYVKEEKILSRLDEDLESLKNECCQTCNQKLQTATHSHLLTEANQKHSASLVELSIIKESIDALQTELLLIPVSNTPEPKNYETVNEAHEHRNKLMLLNQEHQSRENEADPYQAQIDSMQNTAIEVIDLTELNSVAKFVDHQEFLLKLLTNKDSFIRKKIIEQNLAYLNSRLNYYLNALGLPHEVVFQNDLSVTITELGRELSSGNLSRGEMARLSLGLSFSFRDVWESLFQSINILMMDESIDSGIDSNGTDAAVKLLRDMAREHHKDVWLISHKEELVSKCTSICKVTKENGFTTFDFD
jgi:DNA repair exonuclease SbcCD ATPase subunit